MKEDEREEVALDARDYISTDHHDLKRHHLAPMDFGGATTIVTSSGFGDGSYPAWILKAGERAVGLEVQFISPDTPGPFRSPI